VSTVVMAVVAFVLQPWHYAGAPPDRDAPRGRCPRRGSRADRVSHRLRRPGRCCADGVVASCNLDRQVRHGRPGGNAGGVQHGRDEPGRRAVAADHRGDEHHQPRQAGRGGRSRGLVPAAHAVCRAADVRADHDTFLARQRDSRRRLHGVHRRHPRTRSAGETSQPVASSGIHLTVTPYTKLNPGGVLPYAIGGPALVAVGIFVLYRIRRRQTDAAEAS
jgi:hypothetical protein